MRSTSACTCTCIGRLLATTALLGLVAVSAAGCKSSPMADITGSVTASDDRGSPGERRTVEEWRREADAAGERYRARPKDAVTAIRYAEALRRTGQHDQAAAVLQQAVIHNPHDKRIMGAYGRALAEVGNLEQALDFLSRAHTPDQPDWRVLSAQGAVLDQMGRHDEARRYYENALKIVPGEPSVLSNLGLSYALSKKLKQAEETLRSASARGGSDRRVRQNLALVVGLQGRFKEAEDIARADLPPAEAAENITYLRQMLAQHRGRKPRGRVQATADSES
jgi:Flp pilus assembly protein TadD